MTDPSDKPENHYIIEFVQIGQSVKVSAVDPVSGLEVSLVGPAQASRDYLSRLVVQKLEKRKQDGL